MRPHGIVFVAPGFDHRFGFDSVAKPLHRQKLVPESTVERFVRAVLPKLGRFDQCSIDFSGMRPTQQSAGDELRAVGEAKIARRAMHAKELGQHLDDARGADAAGDIDGRAFPGEFVNYSETLQLARS
jgi:hypothetical protein